MARRTYFIGRGKDCDIRLADRTVSRRHAELVVTEDGRYYLTDCASTQGTRVLRERAWISVRQSFVVEDDQLRFGHFHTSIRALLAASKQRSGRESKAAKQRIDHNEPLTGQVVRNPQTGEVEKASDRMPSQRFSL